MEGRRRELQQQEEGHKHDVSIGQRIQEFLLPRDWRFSLGDLCGYICCPPFLRCIVSKVGFDPPTPSYRIRESTNEEGKYDLELDQAVVGKFSPGALDCLEAFLTPSESGNNVACIYLRCFEDARFVVLLTHGNAADMGDMLFHAFDIAKAFHCDVFSYDYSGYGATGGSPSEANLYADAMTAWNALTGERYNINPSSIILCGHSMGTVATVDLAARVKAAGVVLIAPLASGLRIADPSIRRTWSIDAFPSIEKIAKVTSPTLVIHGTDDQVCNLSHGIALCDKCPASVPPLWLNGAGHTDIFLYTAYWDRLKYFTENEVQIVPLTRE